MKKGIMLTNEFRITSLDRMNVVVQKYSPSKTIEKEDGTKKIIESSWSNYSYHANIKQAVVSISDELINLTVEDGANAVIKKIEELEEIINNIKVVNLNE